MTNNRHTEKAQNTSILGLLGLAIRARKARGGATVAEMMIRSDKARLVLIAQDSSESTKRLFKRLAERHGIPLLEQHTQDEYGQSLNGAPRAVLVVLDRHFAAGMIKKAGMDSLRTGRPH